MPIFSAHKLITAALGLSLAACGATNQQNESPTATLMLLTYQTGTATPTESVNEGPEPPQPSSTPVIYTIVAGDTLYTIAARFGIELDALRAANPSVDASLLVPGATILIPAAGAINATALPTPTPVALKLSEPGCYLTGAGELWCFVLALNDQDQAIENLTGVVQLLAADGEVLTIIEAAPLLNIMASGERMPLVAYIQNPPQGWVSARGQLLTAYAIAEDDQTYLDAELANEDIDISADGLSARIAGEVSLPSAQPASSVWVLAVAYDANGDVVGVRRWESSGEVEFYFWVYSLSTRIAEVDLLVEARP